VNKRIGPSVDAISGLTLESLWLTPIAIIQLVVVAMTAGLTMGQGTPIHTVLLLSAGVVTAVPLLLFAAGARRSTLTLMGILQFVAPIIQFIIGVWILHEPMSVERWIGFGLVWVALTLLTIDSIIAARRSRSASVAAGVSDVAELT
jgi:chloramphenicol-sensitive protein RarD